MRVRIKMNSIIALTLLSILVLSLVSCSGTSVPDSLNTQVASEITTIMDTSATDEPTDHITTIPESIDNAPVQTPEIKNWDGAELLILCYDGERGGDIFFDDTNTVKCGNKAYLWNTVLMLRLCGGNVVIS